MLLVVPLILALAVVSVMGMVSARNMTARLSDITGVKIPLASLLSRLAETQLEQALWFERAMVFAEREDERSFAAALSEFNGLSAAIAADLDRARELASAPKGMGGIGASRDLRRAAELLSRIASRRAGYERGARGVLAPQALGLPGEVGDATLAEVQSLESALYEDIEALREELSLYAQNAAGEVLRIERSLYVSMIVAASLVVLLGLIAFPLLLLFWEGDHDSPAGEDRSSTSERLAPPVGSRRGAHPSKARG
jgi:hypothetical protein